MKLSKIALAQACALSIMVSATVTLPTAASSQETPGLQLARQAFASIDTADRGFIDQGEFANYGSDVFVSMDADDDSKLSLSEFLSWDYGMRPLAAEQGREAAYETALRVVFAFWDRDGDGKISEREQRLSLDADFQRADEDKDALLTEDEFVLGFTVMMALRAAINPAPAD